MNKSIEWLNKFKVASSEVEADQFLISNGWDLFPYVLVNEKTNKPVKLGDVVRSFRGERATIDGGTAPQTPASTGKVYSEHGSRYPHVYGLKWVKARGTNDLRAILFPKEGK